MFKNKNDLKEKLLEQEHNGFVITLEVMATFLIIFISAIMLTYCLRVMNTQRYMNTVLTSTATEASRWGGTYSRAYKINIGDKRMIDSAQEQLDYIASDFNCSIIGYPEYIEQYSTPIVIKIDYSLPSVFSTMGTLSGAGSNQAKMYDKTKNMSMEIQVYSIMKSGGLLSESW